MRKKSQEYQYLETLAKRLTLFKDEKEKLEDLKKGYAAECSLDRLQNFLTEEKLPCIDDLYLETHDSCVQIDKLLVVDKVVYVVDVKNYSGKYTFSENEWVKNEMPLQENIFEQLHNAMRAVKRVLLQAGADDLTVKGVLVFMNPNATIDIKDPVTDLVYDVRTVSGWLIDLATKVTAAEDDSWCEVLKENSLKNFKYTKALATARVDYLKRGILCRDCAQVDTKRTRYSYKCYSCIDQSIHSEPRETAYVRTICEYGTIFRERDLVFHDLVAFFGSKIDKQYLRKILKKHFKLKVTRGQFSCYHNRGIIFEYWFEDKMDYFCSLEKRNNWSL